MKTEELDNNLIKVKGEIVKAAGKAGRSPDEIELIAVSKNHSVEKIRYFQQQGIRVFGENRVQELIEKDEELINISWHFIGHLQRNKVKYILRMKNCKMIHSVDSWRLAREIDQRAKKNERVMPVLLEVNVAGDENKFGMKTTEIEGFLKQAAQLKYLEVKGLMTIAPYTDDPEEVRPFFRQLASLKSNLNEQGYQLEELSMGMTNDFTVAIEEGATMIRVGSGLFGMR